MKIEEQLARERNISDDHRDLSVSYDRVADILKAKGDLDEALELFQKSKEIRERLIQERNTPEDRRDLLISCLKVGSNLETKGDLDGALGLYLKALEIAEQLVQERGTADDNSDLSGIYSMIADSRAGLYLREAV